MIPQLLQEAIDDAKEPGDLMPTEAAIAAASWLIDRLGDRAPHVTVACSGRVDIGRDGTWWLADADGIEIVRRRGLSVRSRWLSPPSV